jgi:hypothetical protein
MKLVGKWQPVVVNSADCWLMILTIEQYQNCELSPQGLAAHTESSLMPRGTAAVEAGSFLYEYTTIAICGLAPDYT